MEKFDGLPSDEAYSKAQLLLERLIFLYFVQNRGWLEQKASMLFASFEPHRLRPDEFSYYSKFLERLFWSLSVPPKASLSYRFEGVPFLNGGLFDDDEFDPTPQGRKRNPSLSVRNWTIARVFDDLLEAFNFTVREDTPLNQEVAVDPEMLGKVFESIVLHAESADPVTYAPDKRKETGSYYTARIVVHFNCREVLYQYLLPRMNAAFANVPWQSRLRRLLELDATDGLSPDGIAILHGCLTSEQGSFLLELLKKLRCCDPAVGSGAFMVGLLHELTNLRRLAQTAANGGKDPVQHRSRWLQETKADIIQNCLFGVDIQQQAIEICMLRLWLSLVVDYDLGVNPFTANPKQFLEALNEISQLPNLEMNFKRGDSLHDYICGEPVRVVPGEVHQYRDYFVRVQKLADRLHHETSFRHKRELRLDILEQKLILGEVAIHDARKRALEEEPSRGLFGEGSGPADRKRRVDETLKQLDDAQHLLEEARKGYIELRRQPDRLDFRRRLLRLEGASFDGPLNFVWAMDFPQVFGSGRPGGRGFDIMVGNPPFVTARDPAKRKLYRERWQPYCHKKYHLLVPFFPLSFGLLKPGGQLGFIVSNAFAKRDFGKPLVEQFFPSVGLQKIVDCSGLMFPGHGTPTCLVFGANTKLPESTTVRTAILLPGGGDLRTPPEDSPLWHTLESRHDDPGYDDGQVKVADRSRQDMAYFPWVLDAGNAPLKEKLQSGDELREFVESVGICFFTNAEDVFVVTQDFARRANLSEKLLEVCQNGEDIRNWSMDSDLLTLKPYGPDWDPISLKDWPSDANYLRLFRKPLGQRATFSGRTYDEEGKLWYGYHIVNHDKLVNSSLMPFCFVATHCHFVLGSERRLYRQSAPIAVFRGAARQSVSLVAATANSSAALFWLKQVCYNKGAGEDEERDRFEFAGGKVEQMPVPERIAAALKGDGNPLASRLSELAQACSERGQVLPALAMKKLFEKAGEAYHKWNSSLPGHVKPNEIVGEPFESAEELRQAYERDVAERERLRSEMIALQEEMDWLVYAAYGLLPDDHAAVQIPAAPEPLHRDLRPYRLWQKAEGRFDAAIALIPADWTTERKALWQARLQAIRDDEHIRRIEQPVYKRRWDEQWKVENRWECGPVAYEAELRHAFDWWLSEKAEWWLEYKAKDQQATLHDWAKALWKDERIRAAVEVVEPSAAKLDGELPVPELVPQGFERLLKEVVDEETVPVDIPFAKPWEELEEKKVAGWKKARQIRGKLNVPRERFHLISKSAYSWAGRLFKE